MSLLPSDNPGTLNEDCPIAGSQKGGYVYSFFLNCRLPQQFFLDWQNEAKMLSLFKEAATSVRRLTHDNPAPYLANER